MAFQNNELSLHIMFKIDHHIEYLLLKHDCVIVPGFGGFVVHSLPSRYDESDGMILPPATTVGFNPQLTLNDSLLIQSYIEAHDMSYPEAQREVEKETHELKERISDNSYFDINSVGRISINSMGSYEFEPCQAGILVPRLYGLSGIETSDNETFLQYDKEKKDNVSFSNMTDENAEEKVITIRTSTLRKIAVACIAACFITAIPFLSQHKDSYQLLSGVNSTIISNLQPNTEETISPNVTPQKSVHNVYVQKKVEPKVVASELTVNTVAPKMTKAETPASSKAELQTLAIAEVKSPSYTIVLAAQVPLKNAEVYVKQLIENGYKNVRIIGEGKGRKVVIGTYKTEEEAQKTKREINKHDGMASAWVLEMKG